MARHEDVIFALFGTYFLVRAHIALRTGKADLKSMHFYRPAGGFWFIVIIHAITGSIMLFTGLSAL